MVLVDLGGLKIKNTAVENAKKRKQESLRNMLFDNRILKRWSDALPLVQRFTNEIVCVSPAQLLIGISIQLNRGIRRLLSLTGLIRCWLRKECSLIRHSGYNAKRILFIWKPYTL